MSRYPVVLLDAGGTIIGPRESFGAVYRRVFRLLGVDVSAEIFERSIHEVWNALMEELPSGADRYGHYSGGEEEFWLRFSRRTVKHATGDEIDEELAGKALEMLREAFRQPAAWQVYPDVFPALDALKADGVRLGVVSNWDSRLPRILEMLGLTEYFDAVGVSHLEGVEKPDPALFHRVLERMNGEPSRALHVGDIPELDGAGARAAGIDDLLVDRHGRLDASHEAVPDLEELPRIARCGRPGETG
jgi:putative hydrolase of the HAD superfamily